MTTAGLPKTIVHKGKKYNLLDIQYSKTNADLAGQIYANRLPNASYVISSVFNKNKETFGIYTSMKVSNDPIKTEDVGDYGRIKKPQKPKTYAQKMADKKKLEMQTEKQMDAYTLGKGYKRTPGKMVGWFGKSTEPVDIIKEANHQISQLTRTGMRVVTTIKPGYLVIWSNSRKAWRARTGVSSVMPPGAHKIDANMIIIEAPKAIVNQIEGHLIELPLYSNSFEARFKPKQVGNWVGKGTRHYNVDRHGANTDSFYNRDGTCVLTKTKCDYEGRGGKGYCDGCCRAG